jgi:hypothetical protein
LSLADCSAERDIFWKPSATTDCGKLSSSAAMARPASPKNRLTVFGTVINPEARKT